MTLQFIKGNAFHTPNYGELVYLEEALIQLDENGFIQAVWTKEDSQYQTKLEEASHSNAFKELEEGQYLLPGFIDLHIHAPQWPQAGVALDDPLNVWLDECTFPLEAKYSDIEFSREVYTDLVKQLLARGTTTALYFATVHLESSYLLAELCAELGQRGLVGKVVMDNPGEVPDFYRDQSTDSAIEDTVEFIKRVRKLNERTIQGVYPVVTPRFVPSCSDEALRRLGQVAKKYDVHVQSHCSEGEWQHQYVIDRFGKHDTEVLRDFGLLGSKTVMAHCNFMDEADAQIFKETGTAMGHCPISNAYFANAVLPVKKFKEMGVEIGLGTDISGGFSPSLYDNLKQTVILSRTLEDGVDASLSSKDRGVPSSRVSMVEAFYLVTKGGGRSLDLSVGSFEVGSSFDAQIVDTNTKLNPIPNFGMYSSPVHLLEKILYQTLPVNIQEVWVQGRKVHQL